MEKKVIPGVVLGSRELEVEIAKMLKTERRHSNILAVRGKLDSRRRSLAKAKLIDRGLRFR
jgi:hypothetical protein